MTMAEILAAVDDHGFEDTEASRKTQVTNAVIGSICSREPWTFLEADASVTFAAATAAITLPSDFRAALSLIIPSLGLTLVPERADTIIKNRPSGLDAAGTPRHYYFVGNELRVVPVQATEYTGTLYYLRNHAQVTESSVEADILIPPGHHQGIVDGVCSRLYAMEDDGENAMLFKSLYEQDIAEMADTWKRQYDLPDRVIDVFENGEGWY